MLVRELMIQHPRCCGEGIDLAAAAGVLRATGCGALPVIDLEGRVAGIITDHDIRLAASRGNTTLSETTAAQVMTNEVAAVHAGDDVHSALKIMNDRHVRRLPVVNYFGELEGLFCATDVMLGADDETRWQPNLSPPDVMGTLKGIYSHPEMAVT